jgi:hypothetical protein
MQKVSAADTLRKTIFMLEIRQIVERKLLSEQLKATYDSVKPLNVLRKMIGEITEPSVLKDDLVQSAIGLVSGYVSRKLLVRSSKNPILRLAGIIAQFGVTTFVANNSASIEAMGIQYLNRFADFCRKNKPKKE